MGVASSDILKPKPQAQQDFGILALGKSTRNLQPNCSPWPGCIQLKKGRGHTIVVIVTLHSTPWQAAVSCCHSLVHPKGPGQMRERHRESRCGAWLLGLHAKLLGAGFPLPVCSHEPVVSRLEHTRSFPGRGCNIVIICHLLAALKRAPGERGCGTQWLGQRFPGPQVSVQPRIPTCWLQSQGGSASGFFSS